MKSALLTAEALKIQQGLEEEKQLILDGSLQCSFTINNGAFYHLTGPSGVGKSTLLWTLARLHPLSGGLLRWRDKAHTEIAPAQWRAEIALLPQQSVIYAATVLENLLHPFSNFYIQKQRIKTKSSSPPPVELLLTELEAVGLFNIPLQRQATALSGGQQARLALVRLLLTQPQIILADEPAAGADENVAHLIFKRLQTFCEQGGAVILTSHVHSEHITGTQIFLDGNASLQIK
jgi:putative ABC transport system ATP-binding protein